MKAKHLFLKSDHLVSLPSEMLHLNENPAEPKPNQTEYAGETALNMSCQSARRGERHHLLSTTDPKPANTSVGTQKT